MSLKRGRYSTEEELYVTENVHIMAAIDIASKLGRNIESVENFIKKNKLKAVNTQEEEDENVRLIGVLHSGPHWKKICLALTDGEKILFEEDWVNVIQQFGEDVWYTEEMYIIDWLLLNIKKYRTLKTEKDSLQRIEDLEKLIEVEYEKEPELRNSMDMVGYQQELGSTRASLSQHTEALKKILEKIEKISEKLKANREERRDIKANEDTYWGYITMLDDEKFRKDESRKAQLMKMAQDKAREALYEYHEYMDGMVDIPLLTPEIALRNAKEGKETARNEA